MCRRGVGRLQQHGWGWYSGDLFTQSQIGTQPSLGSKMPIEGKSGLTMTLIMTWVWLKVKGRSLG